MKTKNEQTQKSIADSIENKTDTVYPEVTINGQDNIIDENEIEISSEELNASLTNLQLENVALVKTLNVLQEEKMMLQELFNRTSEELSNLKKPSLLVAETSSVMKDKAIVKLPNGNKFYSYVSNQVKNLRAGDAVLVEQKSLNVVEKLNLDSNLEVEKFIVIEKPKESWKDIGGLTHEINEVKEVIELPLNNPGLFEKIGIKPPKGVLLHGPPGTGKTLLAKAVAKSTNATFIEIVGSELVQKFIGEGAKLVKEIFKMAREKAPCLIFIDEIDALAAMRIETGTSGEREVNRTFMQLLAELDGFKHLDNVKIIGATNRIDILDKAIIRPGRLDRLIEVGLPDEKGLLEIFRVHSRNMNLKNVKFKELVKQMDEFTGAEVSAVCTEAGYFAIREKRDHATQKDFLAAIEKVQQIEEESDEHKVFFG